MKKAIAHFFFFFFFFFLKKKEKRKKKGVHFKLFFFFFFFWLEENDQDVENQARFVIKAYLREFANLTDNIICGPASLKLSP